MLEQKFYLLLESLAQLNDLNLHFVLTILFWQIFILTDCSFQPDYNCGNSFALSLVDKVTTGTERFVSVFVNVGT